jgi:hypothetical protein
MEHRAQPHGSAGNRGRDATGGTRCESTALRPLSAQMRTQRAALAASRRLCVRSAPQMRTQRAALAASRRLCVRSASRMRTQRGALAASRRLCVRFAPRVRRSAPQVRSMGPAWRSCRERAAKMAAHRRRDGGAPSLSPCRGRARLYEMRLIVPAPCCASPGARRHLAARRLERAGALLRVAWSAPAPCCASPGVRRHLRATPAAALGNKCRLAQTRTRARRESPAPHTRGSGWRSHAKAQRRSLWVPRLDAKSALLSAR